MTHRTYGWVGVSWGNMAGFPEEPGRSDDTRCMEPCYLGEMLRDPTVVGFCLDTADPEIGMVITYRNPAILRALC